ncbi:MAG: HAMP domain-containing protein [Gammaproteobacteria bacterium]|nr:HAMP domain-containing protein [Gammaproteobacteria bacterium]
MKNYSIEQRLSRRVAIVAGLIFLFAATTTDLVITRWLENGFNRDLNAKANLLITLVKDKPEGLDFDFADEFMQEFATEINPEYFQLWQEDKNVFERSRSLKNNDLPFLGLKQTEQALMDIILMDGRRGRMIQIVFLPQIPEKEDRTPEKLASQKPMALAVAREREGIERIITLVHLSSFFGTTIILMLIHFLVKLTVRNSLKPLIEIQEKIKILDADNLKFRLEITHPPNELKEVIRQFNQLLTRLGESSSREQRFTSDVAHELRTPIAELRSLSEVALKWPDDTNLVKEFYQDVLASSMQMQLMVNNLLALARCEKGQVFLEPRETELKALLLECWDHYRHDADDKYLKFNCTIPDNLKIMTSLTEFEQIINNLFSNAVSYGTANSEIRVETNILDDRANLVISNTAKHLDKPDLSVMFDRLWRKSIARTSSDHTGLGLALVKAYAELLELKISTQLSEQNRFTIIINSIPAVETTH